MSNPKDSEERYRKAIEANSSDAVAHFNLGVMLEKRGDLEAAEEHYRKAINAQPKHANALTNLGVLLGRRGDLEAAEEHCRKAINAQPELAGAHHNLGVLLEQICHLQEAQLQYRLALHFNPHHLVQFLNTLGGRRPASTGIEAIRLDQVVSRIRECKHDTLASTLLQDALQTTLNAAARDFASHYHGLQLSRHLSWRASAEGVFRLLVEAVLLLHVPDAGEADAPLDQWTQVAEEHSTALADALLAIRRINECALRAGGSAHASSTDLGETAEGGPMMGLPSNGTAAAGDRVPRSGVRPA